MKQREFINKACKAIAENKIRSSTVRGLIIEIAANGQDRSISCPRATVKPQQQSSKHWKN